MELRYEFSISLSVKFTVYILQLGFIPNGMNSAPQTIKKLESQSVFKKYLKNWHMVYQKGHYTYR